MKSLLAVVVIGGLAVAGCSSSSSSKSSSSSSASGSSSASSSSSASGGGDQASQLDALSSSVQESVHATFKAVYTASTPGGQNQTITIEQKPPKTLFSASGGSVINDGTTTHFCSDSGGQKTCLTQSGPNPLAGVQQLFSPQGVVTAIQAYKAQIAAHASGVDVNFSSASYAGLDSTCVSATAAGQTGKYCVAKNGGLITYESAGGSSFQLTSYTTNVPDSDFSVSGAASVTIPGGY